MTNEELINQRKKEIAELTSQIDKSKINYNLPMGSWVSYKESEIFDRERMSIDEQIRGLEYLKKCGIFPFSDTRTEIIFTDECVDGAIDTLHKYQKIFDKYEILTASFEDSDSPEVCSKKIDEFCIDTMRGLLGEYYADKVKQELKDASN